MSDRDLQWRKELAEFLKAKRARLHPRDAGLPVSARRRAPGLLREEVAQLAGISVTWYTWLEQARPKKNPSVPVLQRLADALRLSPAERKHLIGLARPELIAKPPAAHVFPESLASLLRNLGPNPIYVVDPRWDVVAWNDAAARLFGDFGAVDPGTRNILELLFLDPRWRTLFVGWETVAESAVGQYRASHARLKADRAARERVARLSAASPEFSQWWSRQDVAAPANWRKTLNAPGAGRIVFDYASLQVDSALGEFQFIIYTPAADGESPQKYARFLHGAKPRRRTAPRRSSRRRK